MPKDNQPAGYYEYRALSAENERAWDAASEEWGYASVQELGERRAKLEARSRRCAERAVDVR